MIKTVEQMRTHFRKQHNNGKRLGDVVIAVFDLADAMEIEGALPRTHLKSLVRRVMDEGYDPYREDGFWDFYSEEECVDEMLGAVAGEVENVWGGLNSLLGPFCPFFVDEVYGDSAVAR